MTYLPILGIPHSRPARLFTLIALALLTWCGEAMAAQMTLNWTDNSSNESGFRVERATGSTGAFSVISTTGANVSSYVDTSLAPSTLYRYRVCAFNSAGSSGFTNIASGTTPAGSNTAPTLSAIGSQTTTEDRATTAAAFTIGDAETSASALTLSGSSSNTTLIPTSGITFGGSGSNRTVTVKPAANQSGSATITVRVSDGALSTSRTFTTSVTAVNDTPTITDIANRTVASGGSTGAIPFTVGDVETAASSLTVTATSSNQTLLPNSRIALGGSGANRTITVSPAAGQTGTATVTVRVSDGSASISDSFAVSVTNSSTTTNTAPTISSIAGQEIAMNGTTGALAFTIGDAQTAASSLTLTVNSSDTTLVPVGNITLGGSGASRTITVRPLSNSTGWSTIWVKVSDGSLTQTTSFVVNVSAVLTYTDIGSPALAGSQSVNGSTITVTAGGKDIWGTSDQFRFAHTALAGDSELTVRVTSITKSHDSAKAGLMYRASTAANAACVFLCVTPASGIGLQYRSTSGAVTAHRSTGTTALPRWLKLTRVGDTFYGFQSADGTTWKLVDSITVNLPDTARAGLAVTSHNTAASTTARFESLSVD